MNKKDIKKLEAEIEKHNVYPMTAEQEQGTFVDGIAHALKILNNQ